MPDVVTRIQDVQPGKLRHQRLPNTDELLPGPPDRTLLTQTVAAPLLTEGRKDRGPAVALQREK